MRAFGLIFLTQWEGPDIVFVKIAPPTRFLRIGASTLTRSPAMARNWGRLVNLRGRRCAVGNSRCNGRLGIKGCTCYCHLRSSYGLCPEMVPRCSRIGLQMSARVGRGAGRSAQPVIQPATGNKRAKVSSSAMVEGANSLRQSATCSTVTRAAVFDGLARAPSCGRARQKYSLPAQTGSCLLQRTTRVRF